VSGEAPSDDLASPEGLAGEAALAGGSDSATAGAREASGRPRDGKWRFFVTCPRGTEGALRREIAALRIAGARGDMGGVWFEGPLEMGFAVCLHARVAMRVLVELGRFPAATADELYAGARAIDWRPWLTERTTLAVAADVSDNPALHHSGFAALKVKDAVVDALRDAVGARPNVDPRDPDVSIRLHVRGSDARLFLDMAGEPLHRRGYRVAMTEAPLKETLGAALLALGRIDPELPFVDPMAGSGTLPIEQALVARRIAPGLRRRFGFQRWPSFGAAAARQAFERLVERARADELPAAPAPIVCADRFRAALEAARQNATAAGVDRDITFELGEARDLTPRWTHGNVVVNPPYGERLMGAGDEAARREEHVQTLKLVGLYRGLVEAFERFGGWGVVVLSGNPLWTREMRRKPAISHRLFNGPLEVRLLRYEIPPGPANAPPRV
jgi:23S rRNA G2445 N2-methylase RlmL